jgi:glucose-6-phosphate 1-dehydrogenase
LRDVGQNHALELLAALLMEVPEKLTTESITAARAAVLKSLVPATAENLKGAFRGQYEGYHAEEGVAKGSSTETYFRLPLTLDSIRYKDVPIVIEAGKALDGSLVDVRVEFRDPKGCDCAGTPHAAHESSLTFTIQPGAKISFEGYAPSILEGVKLPKSFELPAETGAGMLPEAYEQLIHDAFRGDKTLFPTSEEVFHSWKFTTSVLENWKATPLATYPKGSKPSDIR